MRRDYIFWGMVLILLGGLLFLNAAGVPLPGGINAMQLFWPAALVLLGAWILLGYFWQGTGAEGESRTIQLQGARQASFRLNYGAGRLRLGAGASGDQFLTGTFSGNVEQKVRLDGDQLKVRLEMGPFPSFLFGGSGGAEWEIRLNRDVPTSMRVETGATQSELDLSELHISDLKLSTGASKTDLTLPARAGMTTVNIELGAASLDIRVPEGVAARVRAEQGISAIEVDTARFPFSNGIYESTDFSGAQNRVDLVIQAGVGRVVVR
jgi:hypothetical protein